VIEPIAQWKGPSSANVICDICLIGETVRCGYQRKGSAKSQPNEARAYREGFAK